MLKWFETHSRDLPWKANNDPYSVWLSEIILQQTRVEQGTPYFEKFIKKYPTIQTLASATEDEVMKMWEGLGYYSRARNLHATAKIITKQFNGVFPSSYEEIIKLKGIGPYTAAAILSFAFKKPYPVVDGNVLRLISRYIGNFEPVDKSSTISYIKDWLNQIIDSKRPEDFNQALMDMGATVCTPKNPVCGVCPLQKMCYAFHHAAISILPFKQNKVEKRDRTFHYFIFIDSQNDTYISKRGPGDIWQSLYEFPMIENKNDKKLSKKDQLKFIKSYVKDVNSVKIIENLSSKRHILTHQNIHTQYYIIYLNERLCSIKENNLYLVNINNILKFAFPKVLKTFIENYVVRN